MTQEAPAANRPVVLFRPLTWAGLGLGVVFLVLCWFDNTAIRWWLMLPIAGAGSAILLRQVKHTAGLERKVCLYGLCALLGLFVLRDLRMSQKLADLYDRMTEVNRTMGGAYKSFESFMNGKPR
jgi:hypothetical protein